MKPGNSEALLILDSQREIKALEVGLVSAGLDDTDFAREVFRAGHETDYGDPGFDGKHNSPPWKRSIEPEFIVTPGNVESVRVAAEATIAQGGLFSGLIGRRKTARRILDNI